jgi:hypothetical protein
MIPQPTRVDPYGPDDVSLRRLQQLEGFVLPVSTNVPPPKTPEGLLDKASALAIKLQQWKLKKRETKANRSRQLLAIAEGRATSDSLGNPTRRERIQQRRAQRQRPVGPIGLLLSTAGVERGSRRDRRLRSTVAKADRLEMLRTDGLVWLVLLKAEDGI